MNYVCNCKNTRVPSNSEVREIMIEMFPSSAGAWTMDELRHHVSTITLNIIIHNPEYLIPLALWVESNNT